MTPHPSTRSFIVAERGSDWTRWTDVFRAYGPEVVVMVQHADEKIADFSSRVRQRVMDLVSRDELPTRAVLCGGGRVDSGAVAARSTLVRLLAVKMGEIGGGVVRLDDSGPDRYSMAAIAETVSMLAQGTSVRIEHERAAPLAA
jgi:hypothetical protein